MTNAYIFQHSNGANKTNAHTARASHYEHYPLIKGNVVSSFKLRPEYRILNDVSRADELQTSALLVNELFTDGTPIVIAFYPSGKNQKEDLEYFDELQQQLKQKGSKLLVITNQRTDAFSTYNPLLNALHIYHDKHNNIAKVFGLYDPQNPLWNWIPGVEEKETFLPAFYVVAPDLRILDHFIDYNFNFYNSAVKLQQEYMLQRLSTAVHTEKDKPVYYPFPVIEFLR